MRRGLPDVPERVVGSTGENFDAAVGVDGRVGSLVMTPPSELQPDQGPAWRGLPDVPEGVVGPARENFKAAIGVDRDRRLTGDHAAERTPGRPRAGVRRGLPDVPEGVIRADHKDFQASIGVACRGGSAAKSNLRF